MSKGGSSRSIEAIYKLALHKAFRRDVRDIRINAGMPAEGHQDEAHENAYRRTHPFTGFTLLEAMELLKKYHLPSAFYWEMQQYIRFGRYREVRDVEDETLAFKYPKNSKLTTATEKALEKLKQPYVGIYVFEGSSKENVIALIRNRWTSIEESLKAQGGDTTRVRTSQNKERNLLISSLCEKSKDALYEEAEIKKSDRGFYKYKEQIVAKIMREKYGYPKVTFEVVKKYASPPKRSLPTDKSRHKRSMKH
jgi:hypothetical protein